MKVSLQELNNSGNNNESDSLSRQEKSAGGIGGAMLRGVAPQKDAFEGAVSFENLTVEEITDLLLGRKEDASSQE